MGASLARPWLRFHPGRRRAHEDGDAHRSDHCTGIQLAGVGHEPMENAMTDKRIAEQSSESNMAEASKRIDELQEKTGRGK